MTRSPHLRPLLALGALTGALHLAGCAANETAPAVKPAPAAAPVAAPTVTMAPIANPEREAPARREPSPEPRAKSTEAPTAPKRETPPPAPARSGAGPAQDLIRASSLRERGLEELNRGAVGRAVQLLSEASRLAPNNALIKADLERAQRISRAVQGPH